MSEFQGFVRDLHDLTVEVLVSNVVTSRSAGLITRGLTAERAIDRSNATISTIKKDFRRLGLTPLDLSVYDSSWKHDADMWDQMNDLRNAIAHAQAKKLEQMRDAGISDSVSATRSRLVSINRAAKALDRAVWDHLINEMGSSPW